MNEFIACLHVHSSFSDGSANHEEIINKALQSSIDVLFITDHNVFTYGIEGYYNSGNKSLLVIGAEEVHDASRVPQKNHLLALGTSRSHQPDALNPQALIDSVLADSGAAFLAHPFDPELRTFGEDDISWVDWDVQGFTGLEIWNGLSELKIVLKSLLHGTFLSFFPQFLAHEPPQKTRRIWDDLLNKGKKVFIVGGADAHELSFRLGPFKRKIFPYHYHFSAITTHILTPQPLLGQTEIDKKIILDAFKNGSMFVGYDLPASTRGFSFTAINRRGGVQMGSKTSVADTEGFSINLPHFCKMKLLKDGNLIHEHSGKGNVSVQIRGKGIYRVECYKHYCGSYRGWIFSNPIWLE